MGTPRCEELFKENIELMKESRALMDVNKTPEPSPNTPIFDLFAKGLSSRHHVGPPGEGCNSLLKAPADKVRAVHLRGLKAVREGSSGHHRVHRCCWEAYQRKLSQSE
eukprot:6141914-Pleurochrysis_carterae.AAC.1